VEESRRAGAAPLLRRHRGQAGGHRVAGAREEDSSTAPTSLRPWPWPHPPPELELHHITAVSRPYRLAAASRPHWRRSTTGPVEERRAEESGGVGALRQWRRERWGGVCGESRRGSRQVGGEKGIQKI
jgi:hypothetical protein